MRMSGGAAERTHGSRRAGGSPVSADAQQAKKGGISAGALEEARGLVWRHRYRLALGLVIMVVNRAVSLVLPATSKFLMDNVVARQQWDLLPKLALAAGVATVID